MCSGQLSAAMHSSADQNQEMVQVNGSDNPVLHSGENVVFRHREKQAAHKIR